MDVEHQGLELKRTVENFREVSKTACALANAFGGRIVIGVADDGRVVGVPDDALDSLQQRLVGSLQQISPIPLHRISVEEKGGKATVTVEIQQVGQNTFCTYDGIVYYRIGSVNSKLGGRTLQEYLMNRCILSFDESLSQATLSDIDIERLESFLRVRSPRLAFDPGKVLDYLVSLNLARMNGPPSIRSAALLFFAREPARLVPQSEARLVRFRGREPVDVIDSRFVDGTVLEVLGEAEDFIKRNIRTAMRIAGLKRENLPEYPGPVTREALVNALTHRDYFSRDAVQVSILDDRMEVLSPGNLPMGLDVQHLGTVSRQRNPLTYRMMRDLDLVEGLATGIPKMRTAMREAGLPEPIFEEVGGFFRVTLYNKSWVDARRLNRRQRRALEHLSRNPSITSRAYARLAGISRTVAVADLNDLVTKGLVRKVGRTRGAYYELAGRTDLSDIILKD